MRKDRELEGRGNPSGRLCPPQERAEQGRGMEERSSNTDLGVGVGGARLGGGEFGGKEHDSWR